MNAMPAATAVSDAAIQVDWDGTLFGDFTKTDRPHVSHCRVFSADGTQHPDQWVLAYQSEDGQACHHLVGVTDAIYEAVQEGRAFLQARGST